MRLDHIAYRVKDRYKTAQFFENAFGYSIGTEFQIEFDDGSTADCLALLPSEERHPETVEWNVLLADKPNETEGQESIDFHTYHAPPEIFISDGPDGSIVGEWVSARGGVGGVHHIAYQCDDVGATMGEWKDKGYAEFLSEEPMTCPGLSQVFTKPSEVTGVIYELISRSSNNKGFCEDNVKELMNSTTDL
jgi:catechol 2,3-dioxygenase-like lactoylglutathione lyase family enzyme